MVQLSKGRRRGDNFTVRITPDERTRLEVQQASEAGPRKLGPWLVWRALRDADRTATRAGSAAQPGGAVPTSSGSAESGLERAVPIEQRTILDLCAGSGSWSTPYELAGYPVVRVSLPEHDVRTFVPPESVWGVLAAPPCDQFSLARNGHEASNPRDLVRGMECVNACMRIVLQCRPRWWALENPVGYLSAYLGTARDTFDPCDFGDPWTKRTSLWGSFELPVRGPFVAPLGGGPLCTECDPAQRSTTWCNSSAHRAITPPGFARAFYEANP